METATSTCDTCVSVRLPRSMLNPLLTLNTAKKAFTRYERFRLAQIFGYSTEISILQDQIITDQVFGEIFIKFFHAIIQRNWSIIIPIC